MNDISPPPICISITRQWRQRFKGVNRGRLSRGKETTDLVRHSRPSVSELSVGKSGKMRRHILNTHTYSYSFLSQLWYDNDIELNTYCPFRGETCRSRSAKCQLGLKNWFWSACSVVLSLAAVKIAGSIRSSGRM